MKKLLSATILATVLATMAGAQSWPEFAPYTPVPYNPAWVATATKSYDVRTPDKALNTELDADKGLDANGGHNMDASLMWLTDHLGNAPFPGAYFRIDFLEEIQIDALKLWNYNETYQSNTYSHRGVKGVDIYTATSGDPAHDDLPSWTFQTSHEFEEAKAEDGDEGSPPLVFPSRIRARYLLLKINTTHLDNFANDAHTGFSKIQFYYMASPFELSVSDITQTTATLGATLEDSVTSPSLTVYWAFTDQETNALNWASAPGKGSTSVIDFSGGVYTAAATGLLPGSNYVFRFSALSGGETYWSEPGKFTTKTELPEIALLGVSPNSVSEVVARVFIGWAGSTSTAKVSLYWGPEDGGGTPGGWESANPGIAPEVHTLAAGSISSRLRCPRKTRLIICACSRKTEPPPPLLPFRKACCSWLPRTRGRTSKPCGGAAATRTSRRSRRFPTSARRFQGRGTRP